MAVSLAAMVAWAAVPMVMLAVRMGMQLAENSARAKSVRVVAVATGKERKPEVVLAVEIAKANTTMVASVAAASMTEAA